MKFIRTLAETIAAYPALAIGVVATTLILLADYGLPVGGQHALDVQGLVSAAIALLAAILTHTQVSPAEPVAPPAATPPTATTSGASVTVVKS